MFFGRADVYFICSTALLIVMGSEIVTVEMEAILIARLMSVRVSILPLVNSQAYSMSPSLE